MFGTWLFSLKHSFVIHVWQKNKKNNTSMKTPFILLQQAVWHRNLSWQKHVASFVRYICTTHLWFSLSGATMLGPMFCSKGNRKAKKELDFPLMVTWESCVKSVPECLQPMGTNMHRQVQQASFWCSLLSFLGGRLLAMTWISFIFTARRRKHSTRGNRSKYNGCQK